MIIKVKEPLKSEYSLIKEGQIIYTYFHFASSLELPECSPNMVLSIPLLIAKVFYKTQDDMGASLKLSTFRKNKNSLDVGHYQTSIF